MPHQCVHCGKMYPDAAEELLKGCTCSSHFFYYIRKDLANKIKEEAVQQKIEELDKVDKTQVEKDVREIMGIEEKENVPVILDLESIKILEPGKYEIDVVNLFSQKRPLIYKLEEGKYIIDLASTIKANAEELADKIHKVE
jgi:predicted  nucleic acid-binding Zn-ribbon protein